VTPETLAAIARAFNDHDTEAVVAFFADDAVFETPKGPDPWGRRLVGIDQVARAWPRASPGSRTCTTATPSTGSAATGRVSGR
jgi:ketosteroid isomerase-like protein